MPTTNAITSSVFQLLNSDSSLHEFCSLYKGSKRPSGNNNPSATIQTRRMEPGEGSGIWMCDIVVTIYTDLQHNRMIDQDSHGQISSQIFDILSEAEINLPNGHSHPLIANEISEPRWYNRHDHESAEELVFGLIFIDFSANE